MLNQSVVLCSLVIIILPSKLIYASLTTPRSRKTMNVRIYKLQIIILKLTSKIRSDLLIPQQYIIHLPLLHSSYIQLLSFYGYLISNYGSH